MTTPNPETALSETWPHGYDCHCGQGCIPRCQATTRAGTRCLNFVSYHGGLDAPSTVCHTHAECVWTAFIGGTSVKQIADRFGVTRDDVRAVVRRTHHRHRLLRAHPPIPIPTTVPERTAARFTGPTITPEETP